MNMLIKRRQLLMATLVVALGAAVFVNWYFTRSDENLITEKENGSEYVQNLGEAKYVESENVKTQNVESKNVTTGKKETKNDKSDSSETNKMENKTENKSEDVFSEIKLNRTKAHDKAIDELKNTLDTVTVDSVLAERVAKSVDELSDAIKAEADIETLIKAKTGASSVVVINNNGAEIVIEKGKLTEESVLIITELVTENTDIPVENIKISETK